MSQRPPLPAPPKGYARIDGKVVRIDSAPQPQPAKPTPKSVIADPTPKPAIADPALVRIGLSKTDRARLAEEKRAATAARKAATASRIKGLAKPPRPADRDPNITKKGTPRKAKQSTAWKPGQSGTPYVYEHPHGKQTLRTLAEAMFAMDGEAVMAHTPKTVGEVAIRAAWVKSMHGDSRSLVALWDRIFPEQHQTNALADLLAQIGQTGQLKPKHNQDQETEDED